VNSSLEVIPNDEHTSTIHVFEKKSIGWKDHHGKWLATSDCDICQRATGVYVCMGVLTTRVISSVYTGH